MIDTVINSWSTLDTCMSFNFVGTDKPSDPHVGDAGVFGSNFYVWSGSEWIEVCAPEEKYESRMIPAVRVCPSCGAPVDQKLESCPYCDVPYPMKCVH